MASRSSGVALLPSEQMLEMAGHAQEPAAAEDAELVGDAEGVQIFIGAQNELFNLAGCSMVVAPFKNGREQIVGAVGVIGPTRINYARIIPMVDYTAQVVGRMLGQT